MWRWNDGHTHRGDIHTVRMLKEASTRPAALGRAAKPGYGVQGHHDELNPMERAAVDRLLGPVSKGTGHGANDYLEGGE